LQQLLQFRAWLRHTENALLVKGMGVGGCRPWLLVDLRLPLKYPAARIMAVANMCVIRLRSGSSEQNELAARPELLLCEPLQTLANCGQLMDAAHSQVRQIAGIVKVGQRTGDAYQLFTSPGANGQVAVGEHALDRGQVI